MLPDYTRELESSALFKFDVFQSNQQEACLGPSPSSRFLLPLYSLLLIFPPKPRSRLKEVVSEDGTRTHTYRLMRPAFYRLKLPRDEMADPLGFEPRTVRLTAGSSNH